MDIYTSIYPTYILPPPIIVLGMYIHIYIPATVALNSNKSILRLTLYLCMDIGILVLGSSYIIHTTGEQHHGQIYRNKAQ